MSLLLLGFVVALALSTIKNLFGLELSYGPILQDKLAHAVIALVLLGASLGCLYELIFLLPKTKGKDAS